MFHARYPKLKQTWLEQNGCVYGAQPDERGPIGGGRGYTGYPAATSPTIRTLDALLDALQEAKAGDVIYLDGAARIDCTVRVYVEQLVLEIPAGVTLASNRGQGDSRGALIRSESFATKPLIRALGPNVRITGLRLAGPNPHRCLDHHRRAFAEGRGRDYYYKFPTSDGIVTEHAGLCVDNCELGGWSHAAIYLQAGAEHHIHHNFIHHNQYNGLGYGISHDRAFSRIERNLFNYNRHSIAGTGRPQSGYEACHNVEVRHSLSHCFDMHGGRDRQDGSDIAGTRLDIHHNTFRCAKTAVVVRGIPEEESTIRHNWFYHADENGAVRAEGRIQVSDNAYGCR